MLLGGIGLMWGCMSPQQKGAEELVYSKERTPITQVGEP